MPTFKVIGQQEGEGLGTGGSQPAVSGLKGDSARFVSNAALSEYAGRFAASELLHQFGDQDLAAILDKKDQVSVTIGWG